MFVFSIKKKFGEVKMLKGAFTALVTPFKDNKVDFEKLEELVERQIKLGIDGVVPVGTTGESATLSHEEHQAVIETVVKIVNKRVKVIAGAGSNSTEESLSLVRFAQKAGADAALVITPYYNKPTQEGLIAHFKAVAAATDLPIVVYNVPGRTGVNIQPDTLKRLAEIDNVVAIKEASGNLSQIVEMVRLVGDKINIISGDDGLLHPIIAVGGVGVISVLSNIIPDVFAQYFSAVFSGDMDKAKELYLKFYPLAKIMFIETNPVPVKQSMEFLGLCSADVRLPLVRMKENNKNKLKEALEEWGLL